MAILEVEEYESVHLKMERALGDELNVELDTAP